MNPANSLHASAQIFARAGLTNSAVIAEDMACDAEDMPELYEGFARQLAKRALKVSSRDGSAPNKPLPNDQ